MRNGRAARTWARASYFARTRRVSPVSSASAATMIEPLMID
ncbi:MAG TPA: hypothetical protein VN831_05195 [Bradyrhizobium sp.]|nr:hypothetical protein [Bradyrhizobium sp.]